MNFSLLNIIFLFFRIVKRAPPVSMELLKKLTDASRSKKLTMASLKEQE